MVYDQVRHHSGQAVLRQKRLCDRRSVQRLFAVGDYYPPAKKCKLDSAWVGPYLVVSLVGWAVGIQLQPDSPIIMVHCQDLKKIPRPSGLVSWIDTARPVGLPTPPVLGVEGILLSAGTSVKSYHPEGSVMDVSSGSPGTVVTFLPQEVLLVDSTISLHPFFMHRLDVGPIRLTTIAHEFNYRVTVLRDGVKSAAWVGHSQRVAERILEDIGIPGRCHVSDCVCTRAGSALGSAGY